MAGIMIFLSLFILIFGSYPSYKNYFDLINFSINCDFKFVRNFIKPDSDSILLSEEYLVPGDICYLNSNIVIPCDILLIQGYCSVNESEISGENNLVMKTPLIKSDYIFDYKYNKNSIIFQGSIINNCDNETNIGLVINTGFNTYRGNQILNIEFSRDSNFNFFSLSRNFIIIIIILFLVSISLIIYIYFRIKNQTIFLYFFDLSIHLHSKIDLSKIF